MKEKKIYLENELQKARNIKIQDLLGVPSHKEVSVKCPFHNDKSPSLRIYEDNSFYCFGCNAHGHNAIDFVMLLGATFNEAVEELLNN